MKTLIINGQDVRIRKFAVEFSPFETSGVAGVTVWFDKPIDGKDYRQYLPSSEEFKKVFSKIQYRKMIESFLKISFPDYDVKDSALDVPE